ncbi:PP0621 family protein [uncultured Oxalicibacterium sp.]|uniref:PP0621 family protein n=1 Tax=uncultured Oxalicibacterium sp. TaxID=1168540 RepID=UPI0025D3B711|nr:PP0621 family protein [uncultured Oxalicibacterium sp.]
MKLLAWALLIFAVIWVLRSKAKARQKAARDFEAARPDAPMHTEADAEVMVICRECGVHFPVSEAVRDASGRHSFCSIEHRQQYLGH